MVDVMCMEFQRSAEKGADGGNTSKEHTSITTTDASSEDESNAVEVLQLLIDHQQFEDDAHEAMQEETTQ